MSLVLAARTDDRRGFASAALARFPDCLGTGPVLVKPNVVSHEPYPTTTHPDMLDQVLAWLEGREILVADGAAADLLRPGKSLRENPLARGCKDRGLELTDLYDHPMHKKLADSGMELVMSDLAFNTSIISLPVLKSHSQCMMTGALKNHFGLLGRAQRGKLHFGRGDIHKAIASLVQMAPPGLVIMDAVVSMNRTNEARHGGIPVELGHLMAGADPVALDAFGLSLLQKIEPELHGKAPEDIPYIKYALEMGLGTLQYEVEWIE